MNLRRLLSFEPQIGRLSTSLDVVNHKDPPTLQLLRGIVVLVPFLARTPRPFLPPLWAYGHWELHGRVRRRCDLVLDSILEAVPLLLTVPTVCESP